MALWRVRTTVDDRPGFLAVLAASLALRSVNILAVQVHTTEAGAVDEFLVDAPDALTGEELAAAVERGWGRDAWVARAEAQGLFDPPTRAFALAGRVVRDPEALGGVLRELLDADEVIWRPAADKGRCGVAGGAMRLPDPAGGAYEVTRDAPSFTPAEYARAQALLDLAGTMADRSASRCALLLPDGTEVTIRPAGTDDLAAVGAMHERCSAATRHRRYLTGSGGPSAAQLARLLDATRMATLVAAVDERVIAMANLASDGDIAEIALLVEDAWQRRGLGTVLLRRITALAGRAGYAALFAYTQADNTALLRTVRRLGLPSTCERDQALLCVTVPLTDLGAAALPRTPARSTVVSATSEM